MTKRPSREEALNKLQRFCAYQDRCHQEVRSKLLNLGVRGDDLEAVMAHLIAENYLDEERFARSFVGGRFRLKQWGRNRIVMELKRRGISAHHIQKALEEIDEEDYRESLRAALTRKFAGLAGDELFVRRQKAARFAIGRGFEPELVWETLNELKD